MSGKATLTIVTSRKPMKTATAVTARTFQRRVSCMTKRTVAAAGWHASRRGPEGGHRRARPRRDDRRARGIHAPDPLRGGPRDHPPGPPRPDARAHDARPDLRPADRDGLRP